MLPPALLPLWLIGLLSLGLLGGGGYLIWAWTQGVVVGAGYLLSGIGMVLWSLTGRWIVLHLLRRPGADDPRNARTGMVQKIPRPDGTELHVEIYGPDDAPTLVLTHGWGVHSTEFYYAKERLAGEFRLVLWDLPGLGHSRGPKNRDYSLEKLADDLRAVIDAAGNPPVVLLGHSIGGMIVQTFCRLFPAYLERQVSGIVLLDTTYTNPVRTSIASGLMRAIQKPLMEPLCYLTIALWPLVWAANFMSYLNGMAHLQAWFTGFTGHETRGQLDFAAKFNAICSPAVISRGMLAMFRFDETETLPRVHVPVLVLCGHRDRMTRPEASREIASRIPRAELVLLEPGNHMALLEANGDFTRQVAAFTRSLSVGRERSRAA